MTVLVLSDSHGDVEAMAQAVEKTNPDLIVHLGDCWRDAEELRMLFPRIPMEHVPGNCDFSLQEPLEKRLDFEGFSLLICHGHTLRVKESYQIARYTGLERGVGAVLFGHTHVPYLNVSAELTLLNPGSIGRYRPSYAIMDIQDGSCKCELREI